MNSTQILAYSLWKVDHSWRSYFGLSAYVEWCFEIQSTLTNSPSSFSSISQHTLLCNLHSLCLAMKPVMLLCLPLDSCIILLLLFPRCHMGHMTQFGWSSDLVTLDEEKDSSNILNVRLSRESESVSHSVVSHSLLPHGL